MIDSTSITKKIEAHKSTIIEELSKSESHLKRELKQYEESLIKQMKEDMQKYHSSLNIQEQEQSKSINKLLKMVGWKVLILTSITSLTIGILATILITNQMSSKSLIKERTVEATDGNNYLKFKKQELIYDQQKEVYYFKLN